MRLRTAVLGVGAMGRNHLRVYRDIEDVEIVAVCDPDSRLATSIASRHGIKAYASHEELLERARPDAVSVTSPTSTHFRIVSDALAAGCHVLVEKPIAATLEEATALVGLAERSERVVMVGHIERYNPAIQQLVARLRDGTLGRIYEMHARRLGPFPARVRDVGVVVDLATHDLDIMRMLCASEAERVYAEVRQAIHTTSEDLLAGIVRFVGGEVGLLEINWLTPTKVREMSVTGERGMYRVDYLTQDLYYYENASVDVPEWAALSLLRGVSEGAMTRYAVSRAEPLRVEIETFLRAIDTNDRTGVVSPRDGLAALRLAFALIESGRRHTSVELGD